MARERRSKRRPTPGARQAKNTRQGRTESATPERTPRRVTRRGPDGEEVPLAAHEAGLTLHEEPARVRYPVDHPGLPGAFGSWAETWNVAPERYLAELATWAIATLKAAEMDLEALEARRRAQAEALGLAWPERGAEPHPAVVDDVVRQSEPHSQPWLAGRVLQELRAARHSLAVVETARGAEARSAATCAALAVGHAEHHRMMATLKALAEPDALGNRRQRRSGGLSGGRNRERCAERDRELAAAAREIQAANPEWKREAIFAEAGRIFGITGKTAWNRVHHLVPK